MTFNRADNPVIHKSPSYFEDLASSDALPPLVLKGRERVQQIEVRQYEAKHVPEPVVRQIQQMKLVIDKKILELSSCFVRLGERVSPELKRTFVDLQDLSRKSDCSTGIHEDVSTHPSIAQRRASELERCATEQVQECAERYAAAVCADIDATVLHDIAKHLLGVGEPTLLISIRSLFTSVVVTGDTKRRVFTTNLGTDCVLECGYRQGRPQILTSELVGQVPAHMVQKMTVLFG